MHYLLYVYEILRLQESGAKNDNPLKTKNI
jgi:hypothetical protein